MSDSLLPPGLTRKNAVVGLVAGHDAESLLLQVTADDTVHVAKAKINRLYVSRGLSRRRSAIRMAAIEGLLFAAWPPAEGRYFGQDHLRRIGFGVSLGGIVGAALAVEEWKRVRP